MTTSQPTKTALEQVASTYADSILHSIQQEYPNQMQHMMTGPDDRPTPREAHPAFYGCFDWHSSVHGHWSLVYLLNNFPALANKNEIIDKLKTNLSKENIQTIDNLFHKI